ATHKIGLSLALSWIIFYAIHAPSTEVNGTFFLLIIKEAAVGLLIGFTAYMILSAIQIAGGFIDFQMGFSIANVIDPQTGAQSPLMGQYFYTFGLMTLLTLNGHHLLIDGIFYSYRFIPLTQPWLPLGQANIAEFMIRSFNTMFMIALQMSIPVVGSLFLVDIALGVVARTVPQMNIFVVGAPVKTIASFIIIIVVMGVMMAVVQNLFETMLVTMRDVMRLLGGS
ncbi:MAG: flagellar biosynthetic protein FliR, partial [Bacillota bacterium]|nr:flagellar biosynthetic protein FliR [Bacillota bacterium]